MTLLADRDYVQPVAQEVGIEKAVALHANQGKMVGAWIADMLKDELGRKRS